MTDQNDEPGENMFSGRRSFDRQLELLTVAVHTLQRDFGVLNERVESLQQRAVQFTQEVSRVEDALHHMDKALVTRIAIIRVSERVLWMVIAALVGLGAKIFG